MPLILGIESTCDETAAAFVLDGRRVLGETIASQVDLHAIYGGVVPEIASLAHIENLLPVLAQTARAAGRRLEDADAIAVAHRPGLIGSLVIGLTAAKTLAWALSKPLIGVDHIQAHLYSVMLEEGEGTSHSMPLPRAGEVPSERGERGGEGLGPTSNIEHRTLNVDVGGPASSRAVGANDDDHRIAPDDATQPRRNATLVSSAHDALEPELPALGLVVSGGHTALYLVRSWTDIDPLGRTIDDAVGEAYDKVAAILGLGYPGGPIIDRLAREGDAKAVRFPRAMLGRDSLDFSFSGLKTAVLYHVRGRAGREREATSLSQQQVRDVCASFQAACVDTLIRKLRRALERMKARSVIVGGGVAANSGLRAALSSLGLPVHVPALKYCTDNAAMTAGLGDVLLRAGQTAGLDLDAATLSAI